MRLSDSIKLSANNILHRKLRSWLTLLGIIIGVAAVVSIISIGEGAQASVSEKLSGFGADVITVSPGFSKASAFAGFKRIGKKIGNSDASGDGDEPTLTRIDSIVLAGNPNVFQVSETVSGRGNLVFIAEENSVDIQGINPLGWRETSNAELASGRHLTPSDSTVVVIGDRIANSMFRQPITLGRRVVIEEKPFTVVGILKPSGGGGFGGNDSTVYMSLASAWDVTDVEKNTFSLIEVKVVDTEFIEETVEELTQALMLSRKVTEANQNFSMVSAQAIQEQVSSVAETLTLFLGAIAAVSLLVGAVGVANSMFTSVLEQTKEIGILKALGSTNNEIMCIFMIESGLFGLAGGTIGVLFGTAISIGLSELEIISIPMLKGGTTTIVTPQLVIIAIVLSTVIGIVAGAMPARAASKLKPVEALRYE